MHLLRIKTEMHLRSCEIATVPAKYNHLSLMEARGHCGVIFPAFRERKVYIHIG